MGMLISEALDKAADWYDDHEWCNRCFAVVDGQRLNAIFDIPHDVTHGCAECAVFLTSGFRMHSEVRRWTENNRFPYLHEINDREWNSKEETVAGLRELAAKAREQGN